MSWLTSFINWIKSFFARRPSPVAPEPVAEPNDEVVGPTCSWLDPFPEDGHVALLLECGVKTWNVRRRVGSAFWPDMEEANLHDRARTSSSRVWGAPADLVGAARLMLAHVNFKNANLDGVRFVPDDILVPAPCSDKDKQKCGADLREANLTRASLKGAKLMLCNFEKARLRHADLRKADLRKANFARANLRGANLLDARLDGANFAWADLTDAIVSPGALRKANLLGAKLSRVTAMGYEPRGLVFGRNPLRTVRLAPILPGHH